MMIGGFFMVLMIGAFVFGAFGAIDAAVRPFDHWRQIGRSKPAWITLQALVLFPVANLLGLVAAILYLTNVRPKLQAVAGERPTL
jgi:hypothetical protein